MPLGDIWPDKGPNADVWSHLQTGLDLAEEEMEDLPEKVQKFTEAVAKALLLNRTKVILDAKEKGWAELDSELLSFLWVRYATDLEIAREGITRATKALDRYGEIRPTVAVDAIPEKAQSYIREVVHTYIFGFDAACIALCRAALEQLLKHCLVSVGAYTLPQLKREQPTAGTLLAKARQGNLLPTAYDPAYQVIQRGDQLMHSHVFDEKILRQSAADSVRDFTAAAVELLGGPPTFE
jgi:hypothetical protein